jgi:tRNA-specific 2-thiouridylase
MKDFGIRKRILLAMSGGVDSAVAAALLQKQGYVVEGVHFWMTGEKPGESWAGAKLLSQQLNISIRLEDVREQFRMEVIDVFVSKYKQNLTPNPCVVCNPRIKLATLKKIADESGIDLIATGHYARLENRSGKIILKQAKDRNKDQAYFLYRLSSDELVRLIFPLGDYLKQEVKLLAEKLNLSVPQNESQDVCFFQEASGLKDYLARNIELDKGEIVDENGKVLGVHSGLQLYTIGQRFGLGLSGGPYFVIGKIPAKARLVVTKDKQHSSLVVKEVGIAAASWVVDPPILDKIYQFKTRYRMNASSGYFTEKISEEEWKIRFEESQWAVAAGQSLVAYDGDEVIGGGMIV